MASFEELLQQNHPDIAMLLNKPGVREVAEKIVWAEVTGFPWTSQQIVAALQATEYYRTTPQEVRAWDILYITDPKTAEAQTRDTRLQIENWLSRNGIGLNEDQLRQVSNYATVFKWSETQIAQYISDTFWQGNAWSGPAQERIKQMAAQYGVPISDETLMKWGGDFLKGAADEETFQAYLVEQAKSLYPGLSNAFDRGITLDQYVTPYREIAVQELGINGAEIDWRDPKWNAAIHRVDPKTGQAAAMSLSDWTKELRTNGVYGFDKTLRAQEQASQLSRALLEQFGRAA